MPSRPPRDPDATAQWQPPEPGRAWWLPVLFAIIALIVSVAGAFILVTRLSDNDGGGGGVRPTPSATPSATRSQPAPTSQTSNPPTSTAPTMPTAAGTFTVPATLIGLPISDAKTILDGYGIAYTVVPQTNNSALPNTVVSTSPDAGQVVPDGGAVTLYYAQPSAPSTPATPSTSMSTGSSSPTG